MIYSIHDNNFRFSIRFIRVVQIKHLRNIDNRYVVCKEFVRFWKVLENGCAINVRVGKNNTNC